MENICLKICLYCQKPYEAKRRSSKYCSDSCRVGFFNKNKKGNPDQPINVLQLQVLYNSLLEAIGNMPKNEIKNQTIFISDKKETEKTKFKIKRSPIGWVELRRDCQNIEQYNEWEDDLKNDIYLTELEKKQIKATT